MKSGRKGFTLIEVMVVVLIIGVLAAMGVPHYLKTVEVSKADSALGIGHMLSAAYRMYIVDNPRGSLTGAVNNSCTLVTSNYVAKQDWTAAAYTFTLTATGGVNLKRKDRATYGTSGTSNGTYVKWGYTFDDSGVCTPLASTTAPPCPGF
jgi:prepilin-type N-terminal cleavage/methylation domain-containing protein